MIPYGHQFIGEDDIQEVAKILRSNWISRGPKIEEFQDALCKYTGAKYAVVVSNGTAALHLACLAAGIEKGDEVITSPMSFVATANCILYCNGKPVFADIEENTVSVDPNKILKAVDKKVKAIIPVHFAGCPANMIKISDIAKKHKLIVIEDACHALGARYKYDGKWFKVGSCKHSDMSVFSFHPVKHITTGEGGAITTNSRKTYESLMALRAHGIYKDKTARQKGIWYYEMRNLGFNYMITDFQCALGLSQLKKINKFIERRKEIADIYNAAFSDSPYIDTPYCDEDCDSSWHIYVLRLRLNRITKTKKRIFEELRKKGVGVQVHYIPIHLQPFYRKNFGYKKGDFTQSERFYESAMTIPLFVGLKDKDCRKIIKIILETVR